VFIKSYMYKNKTDSPYPYGNYNVQFLEKYDQQ